MERYRIGTLEHRNRVNWRRIALRVTEHTGECSDYIVDEEWQKTKKDYFDQAELVTVSRAGHFVHVDNPRAPF